MLKLVEIPLARNLIVDSDFSLLKKYKGITLVGAMISPFENNCDILSNNYKTIYLSPKTRRDRKKFFAKRDLSIPLCIFRKENIRIITRLNEFIRHDNM